MELIKTEWNENDKKDFIEYLKSISNPDSVPFAVKIINTSKPMVGINMPTLRNIAKEIAKGNFLSFLRLGIHNYYENDIINGALICKIKDFSLQKEMLLKYARNSDNWAEIDSIRIPFNKKNATQYLSFAKECTENEHTFVRRLGVILLFGCVSSDYFEDIINILKELKSEQEYYVNMAVAWLMCEMVIKRPSETIPLVNRNFLNEFTLRKTISKCSDSYRVSDETVAYLRSVNK